MSMYLNKDAVLTGDSSLVFQLNKEAKEKQMAGNKVINATLGTLLDEKGRVSSFPMIDELQKRCMNSESKGYAQIDGGDLYNNNMVKWVFQERLDSCLEKYNVASVATAGGTGALFIAIHNYVEDNQKLLIPDIGWTNYEAIALNMQKRVDKYEIFDEDGKFNVDGILDKAIKEAERAKKVTLIINDPAHNPTGYTMSKKEWSALIKGLNALNSKFPVVLILDLAYMDFAKENRTFFEVIDSTKMKFVTLLACSLSKTLGLYGYRLGALIYVSTVNELQEFEVSSRLTIRATWSNPNHLGIRIFNEIMADEFLVKSLKKYLKDQIALLDKRKNHVLNKLGASLGKEYFEYKDGFFITFKHEEAGEHAKLLRNVMNIYVLPIQNKYLRFAICSFVK